MLCFGYNPKQDLPPDHVGTCLGGLWSLEQPDGSVMNFYPSFRYMMDRVFAVGGPYAVVSPVLSITLLLN